MYLHLLLNVFGSAAHEFLESVTVKCFQLGPNPCSRRFSP